MKNETKQDVFDETLSNLKKMDAQIEGEWGYSQLTIGVGKHGDVESTREIAITEIRDRYAAALPDDLPVIPKCVSEEIRGDYGKNSLLDELAWASQDALPSSEVSEWIDNNEDIFGESWCRGLWIVEENGEVTGYDEQ